MKFKSLALLATLAGSLLLAGCDNSSSTTSANTPAAQEEALKPIKVGVIAGSELEVAEFVQQQAKDLYNLDVELVIFNDYVTPNHALNDGLIDLNAFQHKPYLDEQIAGRHYELSIVGNTFVYPIAAYSYKIKTIDELQDGATIVIPNDPTNLGRALLLLQQKGLIKLADGKGLMPTVLDIAENPHNYKVIELEAPQLPRALNDSTVDLAIINTAYASQVNLTPKDGVFVEDKESPYVNIIVARTADVDNPSIKAFVKAFQTDATAAKADEIFKGGAVKGW